MTDKPNLENKDCDRLVRLLEVKTMINQPLMESERKEVSQVAMMAEKTLIEAMEICLVERKCVAFWSIVPLAFWSLFKDVLNQRLVTNHKQKVAIRAVVYRAMIKAVVDLLHKNDDPMALMATFVSNDDENGFNLSQRKKNFLDQRK